ncbi:MAG: class I SAM-dependent methyltransferase [Roseobacter sp.]
MSDAETLNVYAAQAGEYARLTDDVNAGDPLLHAFIAAMPKGAHVLDLGCGPGASAAQMAKAGLTVDAYDPVPEMVELANQHDGVSAQKATFGDVSGTAVYDGVWANFSLLHAPRADMPGHLARIANALKKNGVFHIAVKTGTGSHRDAIGRLYTYYSGEKLTGLLTNARLTVTDRRVGSGKGLAGDVSAWIALTARA